MLDQGFLDYLRNKVQLFSSKYVNNALLVFCPYHYSSYGVVSKHLDFGNPEMPIGFFGLNQVQIQFND